jgi:hypothetical protein
VLLLGRSLRHFSPAEVKSAVVISLTCTTVAASRSVVLSEVRDASGRNHAWCLAKGPLQRLMWLMESGTGSRHV